MLAHRPERHVTDRSPLLVYADPLDRHRETTCSTLLAGCQDENPAALVFAYQRRPRVLAEQVREHADADAPLTILELCDGDDRSDPASDIGSNVVLEREAATNLTRVGIHVADAVERVGDEPLTVCLGSLTTLLQYVETETAFKFLHVTCSRIESAGGRVHAHLDPDAVDDETIATLQPLFDSALERTAGRWECEEI